MVYILTCLLLSNSASAKIAVGWHSHSELIAKASDVTGLDITVLATVAALESSFRSTVKSDDSSAAGLFQFTDRTWRVTLAQYGHLYNLNKNTSKYDPYANALMGAEYLKENSRILTKRLHREPVLAEIYMAHLIAPRRVVQLDHQANGAYVSLLYPRLAVYNRALFYKRDGNSRTVYEFKHYIGRKVDRAYHTYFDISNEAMNAFITNRNKELYMVYVTKLQEKMAERNRKRNRELGLDVLTITASLSDKYAAKYTTSGKLPIPPAPPATVIVRYATRELMTA